MTERFAYAGQIAFTRVNEKPRKPPTTAGGTDLDATGLFMAPNSSQITLAPYCCYSPQVCGIADQYEGMLMEQSFELPDLSSYETGEYSEGSFRITVRDETVYVWVIQSQVPIKREFAFVITGVPGSLPVSCCASRWSVRGGIPIFGEHKVYLRAIERTNNTVRVAVEHHGFEAIDIAVGVIFARAISTATL